MIAKRVRVGPKQERPDPIALAHEVVALLTYAVDADPSLIEAAARLAGFVKYALDVEHDLDAEMEAQGVEAGEKVIAYGKVNLEGNSIAEWNAEMISTALQCPRSKHPFEHIVISWQADEVPTAEQMAEAVALMAEILGCERNQMVWAAHGNTNNIHIHLIINRIDRETFRATQLGDGWDLDRLAQGCAIIQARQGWRFEANSDYVATGMNEIYSLSEARMIRTEDGVQTRKKGDRAATRDKWQEKPEIAAIAKILREAADWQSLHQELAKRNATFVAKVGGATIVIDREEFKASRFGRDCSMRAILTRLPAFEMAEVEPQGLRGHVHHQAALADLEAELRASREMALVRLQQQEAVSLARGRSRTTSKEEQSPQQAALADAITAASLAIREEYKARIERVRKARLTESEWLRGKRRAIPEITLPTILFSDPAAEEFAEPLKGFQTRTVRGGTEYRRTANASPSFTDYRVCIIVHVSTDADVIAALRVAASRWPTVDVTGSKQFQQQCARLAAEAGIMVTGQHIPQTSKVENPARLALINDLFYHTNWRRSDYPESFPDHALRLDVAPPVGGHPQIVAVPGETGKPAPSVDQNRAARAAHAAAGLSR